MVSGFAPGRLAVTSRVGKSTFGRSLTPSVRYAIAPNSAIASINRLVATGFRMKRSDMFTAVLQLRLRCRSRFYLDPASGNKPQLTFGNDGLSAAQTLLNNNY